MGIFGTVEGDSCATCPPPAKAPRLAPRPSVQSGLSFFCAARTGGVRGGREAEVPSVLPTIGFGGCCAVILDTPVNFSASAPRYLATRLTSCFFAGRSQLLTKAAAASCAVGAAMTVFHAAASGP